MRSLSLCGDLRCYWVTCDGLTWLQSGWLVPTQRTSLPAASSSSQPCKPESCRVWWEPTPTGRSCGWWCRLSEHKTVNQSVHGCFSTCSDKPEQTHLHQLKSPQSQPAEPQSEHRGTTCWIIVWSLSQHSETLRGDFIESWKSSLLVIIYSD